MIDNERWSQDLEVMETGRWSGATPGITGPRARPAPEQPTSLLLKLRGLARDQKSLIEEHPTELQLDAVSHQIQVCILNRAGAVLQASTRCGPCASEFGSGKQEQRCRAPILGSRAEAKLKTLQVAGLDQDRGVCDLKVEKLAPQTYVGSCKLQPVRIR